MKLTTDAGVLWYDTPTTPVREEVILEGDFMGVWYPSDSEYPTLEKTRSASTTEHPYEKHKVINVRRCRRFSPY